MKDSHKKPKKTASFEQYQRHFWPILRQQKKLIGGSFIALLTVAFFQLLEPWPLKVVIDHIIIKNPAGKGLGINSLENLSPLSLLTFAAVALVIITYVRAAGTYFQSIGFALMGNRLMTEVRGMLYRHLQSLSLAYHNKARSGDLIMRLMSDTGKIQEVIVTAMLPLVSNLLILIGIISVMFWFNVKLALLSIAVLPLFWISTTKLSKKIHEASGKQRAREGKMASTATESIGAIKVIQTLSLDQIFSKAFSNQNQKGMKESVRTKRLESGLELTVEVLIALSTALVLWVGARFVLDHTLTPGELIIFLSYLKTAYKPIRNFAKYTTRFAKARAAGDRVIEALEQKPDIVDSPDAVVAPKLAGEILFKNIDYGYEAGHPILKDIDLNVRSGEHIAIIGPSGSGKSTLVGLLLRLYDPWKGGLFINGKDIRAYTLASLRSQITILLQDCLLFGTTVRDNIAYGASQVTEGEIEAAARLANAHDFIMALPNGYDTVIAERGVSLSNGQRQRIAIARAAVRNAPILILDEPTTGLDKENERTVNDALAKLSKGRTTFLITHNTVDLSCYDRIAYIESGRLEVGSHDQLMRIKGRYAALNETHQTPLSSQVSESVL